MYVECDGIYIPKNGSPRIVSAVPRIFNNLDGILVAPGFGERGIEGKLSAIKYVREQKIPFFGICLGMQCAVVCAPGAGRLAQEDR